MDGDQFAFNARHLYRTNLQDAGVTFASSILIQ